MITIEAEYAPRQRVYIDGCKDLVGIITAVQWRNPRVINYEVSWIVNGDSKHDVIEGWRLTEAEK